MDTDSFMEMCSCALRERIPDIIRVGEMIDTISTLPSR